MWPVLLAGTALAGPVVQGEVGGTAASEVEDWSYKADVVRVDHAVRLLHVAPGIAYAPATGADALHFVVYEETAPDTWTLRWDSGLQAVGEDVAYKDSPEIDLVLPPDTRWALGVYLPDGNYELWYDDPAAAVDLGWGSFDGGLWSAENSTYALPLALEGVAPDDRGYKLRIEVELLDVDGDGATEDLDCDDEDPLRHPGAPERCDGVDDDCDGEVDDEVVYDSGWLDRDGDGYGHPSAPALYCEREPPAGVVLNALDCDDGDPDAHPGGTEVCDRADDDCDGEVDEGLPPVTWWTDADGDGYGAADGAFVGCDTNPGGAAANGDDCDDTNAARYPGNGEVCDGFDNDCDGALPEAEADADADGVAGCADCDPADPTVFPGASEVCDGIDHDCDGVVLPRRACDPAPGEGLVVGGGGCGCGGAGGSSWVALVLGLAVCVRVRGATQIEGSGTTAPSPLGRRRDRPHVRRWHTGSLPR